MPHSSLVTISPGLQLDGRQYTLKRDGEPVELPRIPMDILLVLIRRPGELVTRADIAESIWPGSDVDEVMYRINTAVNRIRRALGDDPETPRYIETVIGRGYRFIAPVKFEESEETVRAADFNGNPVALRRLRSRMSPVSMSLKQDQLRLSRRARFLRLPTQSLDGLRGRGCARR